MQTRINKNIKRAISATIALIIVLSLVLIVQISSSSYLKMFDFKDKSAPKKFLNKIDNKCQEAMVASDSIVNLGDFLFVLAENRKLAVNISFKYKKIGKNSDDVFFAQENIEEEVTAKSSILRDRILSVMLGSPMPTIDNKEMTQAMRDTLNDNLSTIKVEEIYFNKFILY